MTEIYDHLHQSKCRNPFDATTEDQTARTGPGKRLRYFRMLLILLRQKTSWSPAIIVAEFWRAVFSIRNIRELISLIKLHPYSGIVEKRPGFALKYLVPNYLARGFTEAECISCFLHHYRRLHASLPERVLEEILQGNLTFYEILCRTNCITLTIGSSRLPFDKEGELSISLKVDGLIVFSIAFTLIPGWVVKSNAKDILLITRLQGARGCLPQLRLVRKCLQEYSPQKLLLAALQGVADVFNVHELQAVCAVKQKSYATTYSGILKNSYDDFFSRLGLTTNSAGFYSSALPIASTPLAAFIGSNRSRATKRRATRQRIRLACATLLLGGATLDL